MEREWTHFDTAFIGLFLLVFGGGIIKGIIILWEFLHPASLMKFEKWLRNWIK